MSSVYAINLSIPFVYISCVAISFETGANKKKSFLTVETPTETLFGKKPLFQCNILLGRIQIFHKKENSIDKSRWGKMFRHLEFSLIGGVTVAIYSTFPLQIPVASLFIHHFLYYSSKYYRSSLKFIQTSDAYSTDGNNSNARCHVWHILLCNIFFSLSA